MPQNDGYNRPGGAFFHPLVYPPPAPTLKRKREPAALVLSGRKIAVKPFSQLPKTFLTWAGADKENGGKTNGQTAVPPKLSGTDLIGAVGGYPYAASMVHVAALQHGYGVGGDGRFGLSAPQPPVQVANLNPHQTG